MDIKEVDTDEQAIIFVEACKAVIREWEDYKHFLQMADWADSEYTKTYYEASAKAKLALFNDVKKALLLLYTTNE